MQNMMREYREALLSGRLDTLIDPSTITDEPELAEWVNTQLAAELKKAISNGYEPNYNPRLLPDGRDPRPIDPPHYDGEAGFYQFYLDPENGAEVIVTCLLYDTDESARPEHIGRIRIA